MSKAEDTKRHQDKMKERAKAEAEAQKEADQKKAAEMAEQAEKAKKKKGPHWRNNCKRNGEEYKRGEPCKLTGKELEGLWGSPDAERCVSLREG